MKMEKSDYSQIWTEPTETIKSVVQKNANKGLWLFSFLYGFSWLINWFQPFMAGRQIGLLQAYFLAVILAPLAGYILFSLWSGIILLTGKLFRGTASFKEVRAAFAWSCFPYIVNVIMWVALGFILGKQLFSVPQGTQPQSQLEVAILFGFFVLRMGAWIWSWVIYINALAAVQNYSHLKAVANVITATLVLGGLLYLLLFFSVQGGAPKAAMILMQGTL